MATNDQYTLGYTFFQDKRNEPLTPEALKQMHPFFRRGYRTAQEDQMKKSNQNFPLFFLTFRLVVKYLYRIGTIF